MMKKNLAVLALLALLVSCAPKNMYYWGHYDEATFKHNKLQTEETKKDLLAVYESIIKNKNKGTRKEVPPGVYADYGYLLIQDGQIEKGSKMLEMELAVYPESIKVVEYILNKTKNKKK